MVDASKLKPGDKVRLSLPFPELPGIIAACNTVSGHDEEVRHGDEFVVAGPFIPPPNTGVLMLTAPFVNLECRLAKFGIMSTHVDLLDYVLPSSESINAVHDMRNAGPPAPAACSCGIVELMRYGCRCGAIERGTSNG